MKLNNKGWGTVEMLLLSGGLLIALVVAVFFISKWYGSLENSVSNRYYFDLENDLEESARKYVKDNNIVVTGEYRIEGYTLEDSYNISLKDKNGNDCDGYVIVRNIDNNILYNGYLACENYQSTNY